MSPPVCGGFIAFKPFKFLIKTGYFPLLDFLRSVDFFPGLLITHSSFLFPRKTGFCFHFIELCQMPFTVCGYKNIQLVTVDPSEG